MTERMDLSQTERYDIVAYRIECAEKTLGVTKPYYYG